MPISFTRAQSRTQTDKNGEAPSVMDFVVQAAGGTAPVQNGASHQLSAYFSTLAAAQSVYPHVTTLSNELAWAALQGAINSVSSAMGGSILVPAGSYLLDQPLSIPSGISLRGDARIGSVLKFTGATDGITCTVSQASDGEIRDLKIITTNASGGKALKFDINQGANWTIDNVYVATSGSGAWAYGFWGNDFQSSRVVNFRAQGGQVGMYLGGQSNATTLIAPLLSAQTVCGLHVDTASAISVLGGTIQAAMVSGIGLGLVQLTAGSQLHLAGTYLENAGSAPVWVDNNGSNLTCDGVELGGSSAVDCIWTHNGGLTRISKLKGFVTCSGAVIRCDGNSSGTSGQSSVVDSYVQNPYSGSAAMTVSNEASTISSTVQRVSYFPYWTADGGVSYAGGGAFTAVSSSPAAGQYISLGGGLYQFNAADVGQAILTTYTRSAGHGVAMANQWGARVIGSDIIAGTNGHGVVLVNCEGPGVRGNQITAQNGYGVFTDGSSAYVDGNWMLLPNTAHICNQSYISPAGNFVHGSGQIVPVPAPPVYTQVTLDDANPGAAPIYLKANGLNRWVISRVSDPESGANAGSSLWITPYADDGVTTLSPIKLDRATSSMILPGTINTGNLNISGASLGGSGTFPAGYSATLQIVINGTLRQIPIL